MRKKEEKNETKSCWPLRYLDSRMTILSFFMFTPRQLLLPRKKKKREMGEGNISFTFNEPNGRFINLKRRPRGKKPNFVKAGFHLELHSLKQQDRRGRNIGRSIISFASQRFHVLSFNKTASFQGISLSFG